MPAPIALEHVVAKALHVRHSKVFSELSGPGATFQNHDATFDTKLMRPAWTSGTHTGNGYATDLPAQPEGGHRNTKSVVPMTVLLSRTSMR